MLAPAAESGDIISRLEIGMIAGDDFADALAVEQGVQRKGVK